jgi:hypothetical protein
VQWFDHASLFKKKGDEDMQARLATLTFSLLALAAASARAQVVGGVLTVTGAEMH